MSQRNLEHQLSYLNDELRYKAYQDLMSGCNHLYSKNKIQYDKLKPVLDNFMVLAEKDPYFLAHLTSYIFKNTDNKDLKVVSAFASSLSDADGTPFSEGSEYRKPNLRVIGQAAVQLLDPKLVARVLEIASIKQPLGEKRTEATHASRSLITAIRKYLRYRENNPAKMKASGFGKIWKWLYRKTHIAPSTEVANILGWKQKDGREFTKVNTLSFKGLTEMEIAEKIRAEKIPVQTALGSLSEKISPVIAVALLEQATGNQAIILRNLWDGQGLLKDKEVMAYFAEKIKTASSAIDRIEKINTEVDEAVTRVMKSVKSEKRKEEVGDIGKIFVHIDASPSMDRAIAYAKDRGAVFAEAVKNPEENFFWGYFQDKGYMLNRPESFEKDAFLAALYGLRSGGYGTNCLGCYEEARKIGCDVDVFITDGEHNRGTIADIVTRYDREGLGRPRAVVVVRFRSGRTIGGWGYQQDLAAELEKLGIPVTEIDPDALVESALVSQTIKQAIAGPLAILDSIMDTKLLKLPTWWEAVTTK
ncbi:MAG: hypothetical protein GY754_03970 [bacterium]|nr:hypothetical protein [bacterium]